MENYEQYRNDLAEKIKASPKDERRGILNEAQKTEDYVNAREEKLKDNKFDPNYENPARSFLEELTPEQIEILKNKKLYHVTSTENSSSILENGLVVEAQTNNDFSFLADLYDKYGLPEKRDFFESFLMGKNLKTESGFISLSAKADTQSYAIPERLRFMLQNMRVIANSPYATPEEKTRSQEILSRYKKQFEKKDGVVCVFEVGIIAPPILNQILRDSRDIDAESTLWYLQDFDEVDFKLFSNIPSRYLKMVSTNDLDESMISNAFDSGNGGVCFNENKVGIDVSRLVPAFQAMYQEFIDKNGRPPRLSEYFGMVTSTR